MLRGGGAGIAKKASRIAHCRDLLLLVGGDVSPKATCLQNLLLCFRLHVNIFETKEVFLFQSGRQADACLSRRSIRPTDSRVPHKFA
jgi:hypothetical protein